MASLDEVAQEAGVSKAAASAALGARPSTTRMSDKTRARIQDTAVRLGYTPNPHAAALSTGRTWTIGVVMPDPDVVITHPNGALNLSTMIGAAGSRGYRIVILTAQKGHRIDPRLMDGCIVLGHVADSMARQLEGVASAVPVLADREQIRGAGRLATDVEEVAVGHRKAARYLYDLGHLDIAIVELHGASARQKALQYFESVAGEMGIEPRLQTWMDRWQVRVYPTTEEICGLDPLPTAVYAFDDDYARTLIAKLAVMGVRTPGDVSVFSGETHRRGIQTAPALDGIDHHYERGTTQMLHRLIDIIEGGGRAEEISIDLPTPDLVVRESCGRPRIGALVGGGGNVEAEQEKDG